jgi:hypothetical protein
VEVMATVNGVGDGDGIGGTGGGEVLEVLLTFLGGFGDGSEGGVWACCEGVVLG